MEYLKADYTEIWIPSPVVPLIGFGDCVCSISSTGLDMVLDEVSGTMVERLRGFDEIVSWYGTRRPEFRAAMDRVHPSCIFLNALPRVSGHEHATDFFCRQVGAPLGATPRLRAEASELRSSIVIHPFSGSASKNWPLEKYQEVAQSLPRVDWAQTGFDNLLDLAQWMKGAAKYMGNDSGISHLAAAIGLPSLVLFGPTDPGVWAPRGENVTVLRYEPVSELDVRTVLAELIRC